MRERKRKRERESNGEIDGDRRNDEPKETLRKKKEQESKQGSVSLITKGP